MDFEIVPAKASDIPSLVNLINRAYRGEEARKGWTHEADLIAGELRTDEASLLQIIDNPGEVLLKCVSENKIQVAFTSKPWKTTFIWAC